MFVIGLALGTSPFCTKRTNLTPPSGPTRRLRPSRAAMSLVASVEPRSHQRTVARHSVVSSAPTTLTSRCSGTLGSTTSASQPPAPVTATETRNLTSTTVAPESLTSTTQAYEGKPTFPMRLCSSLLPSRRSVTARIPTLRTQPTFPTADATDVATSECSPVFLDLRLGVICTPTEPAPLA